VVGSSRPGCAHAGLHQGMPCYVDAHPGSMHMPQATAAVALTLVAPLAQLLVAVHSRTDDVDGLGHVLGVTLHTGMGVEWIECNGM
jgi:hypothetical protein